MLKAEKFPIYQSIIKERKEYADKVHTDLVELSINRSGLEFSDLVTKHFNRLSKVAHPNASRRYVISSARLNMLEFAVEDINKNENMEEAIQKIHDIEGLERRDHIMLAKRTAQSLAERDSSILDMTQVKE